MRLGISHISRKESYSKSFDVGDKLWKERADRISGRDNRDVDLEVHRTMRLSSFVGLPRTSGLLTSSFPLDRPTLILHHVRMLYNRNELRPP